MDDFLLRDRANPFRCVPGLSTTDVPAVHRLLRKAVVAPLAGLKRDTMRWGIFPGSPACRGAPRAQQSRARYKTGRG